VQCGHDNLHQPKSARVQASIALEIPIAVGRTNGANLCKRSVKSMFANPYERSSVALQCAFRIRGHSLEDSYRLCQQVVLNLRT